MKTKDKEAINQSRRHADIVNESRRRARIVRCPDPKPEEVRLQLPAIVRAAVFLQTAMCDLYKKRDSLLTAEGVIFVERMQHELVEFVGPSPITK
jgi:hypothetical protein